MIFLQRFACKRDRSFKEYNYFAIRNVDISIISVISEIELRKPVYSSIYFVLTLVFTRALTRHLYLMYKRKKRKKKGRGRKELLYAA